MCVQNLNNFKRQKFSLKTYTYTKIGMDIKNNKKKNRRTYKMAKLKNLKT